MKIKELEPEYKQTILQNIRMFRQIKGIKQSTMALEIGISQSRYSKLESGQTQNLNNYWNKIAEILNVPVLKLVIDNSSPKSDGSAVTAEEIDNHELGSLELNIQVWKMLEARDLEIIAALKARVEILNRKYQNKKARLQKAELRIKELELLLGIVSVSSVFRRSKPTRGRLN